MLINAQFRKGSNRKGIYVLFMLLFIGMTSYSYFSSESNSEVVATINGEPITKSEMQYFMLLNKANIYNYLYQTFDVEYDDHFWGKDFSGETPLKMLKERSLNDIKQYKVKQLLAEKYQIPVTINFDTLMKKRQKVNAERKEKVKNGGVIYGPISFTPRQYVNKVLDDIVKQTQDILSVSQFKMSDQKLKHQYKEYVSENEEVDTANSLPKKTYSFESFKSIQQNVYTKKKYSMLVDSLTEQADLEIDSLEFKKVQIN